MPTTTRFRLTFALLMSCTMSLLMTAWVTWLNLGLTPDYPLRWLHAFLAAWPAAFVVVFFIGSKVQAFSQRLTKTTQHYRFGRYQLKYPDASSCRQA